MFLCRTTSHTHLLTNCAVLTLNIVQWTQNLLHNSHSTSDSVSHLHNTTCAFSLSHIVLVFLPLFLLFFLFYVIYCLKCSGRISLPQKYKIKNVCNLRVLEKSKIENWGGPWQSRKTHCDWGCTSAEKLEYSIKSNIECNSGISKDIWCHKSMYYYIWIYKYIFCLFLFCYQLFFL